MNDKDLVLPGRGPAPEPGPDETVGADEPEAPKELILPPNLKAVPPADEPETSESEDEDKPLATTEDDEPESNAEHDRSDPNFEGPFVELDPSLCDDIYKAKAAKLHIVFGDHKHVEILFEGTTGIVRHAVATSHVGVMVPKQDEQGMPLNNEPEIEKPYPAKFKMDLGEEELNILTDYEGTKKRLRDMITEQDFPHKEKAKKQAMEMLEAHKEQMAAEALKRSNLTLATEAELKLIERKKRQQEQHQRQQQIAKNRKRAKRH